MTSRSRPAPFDMRGESVQRLHATQGTERVVCYCGARCQQDPLRSFTGRDKYKRMSPIADTVTDAKAVRLALHISASVSLNISPLSPAVARKTGAPVADSADSDRFEGALHCSLVLNATPLLAMLVLGHVGMPRHGVHRLAARHSLARSLTHASSTLSCRDCRDRHHSLLLRRGG